MSFWDELEIFWFLFKENKEEGNRNMLYFKLRYMNKGVLLFLRGIREV